MQVYVFSFQLAWPEKISELLSKVEWNSLISLYNSLAKIWSTFFHCTTFHVYNNWVKGIIVIIKTYKVSTFVGMNVTCAIKVAHTQPVFESGATRLHIMWCSLFRCHSYKFPSIYVLTTIYTLYLIGYM